MNSKGINQNEVGLLYIEKHTEAIYRGKFLLPFYYSDKVCVLQDVIIKKNINGSYKKPSYFGNFKS